MKFQPVFFLWLKAVKWQRQVKLLLFFIGLIVISVLFQNCLKTSSPFELKPFRSIHASLGGNGEGYEGKPTAGYYRFIPEHTCEGVENAKSAIIVLGEKLFLRNYQFNNCTAPLVEIRPDAILRSSFQNEFIAYDDFLFKHYDEAPAGIPDILGEALCRDDFANPRYEVLTHFNRKSGEAVVRIYARDPSLKGDVVVVPDTPISRVMSSLKVSYQGVHLEMNVDLSRTIEGRGKKFPGWIERSDLPLVPAGPMECITGGGIDPKHYPAKELIDRNLAGNSHLINVTQFAYDPESDSFLFIARKEEAEERRTRVYRWNGYKDYLDLHESILGMDVEIQGLQFIPGMHEVILGGSHYENGMGRWTPAWYFYDLRQNTYRYLEGVRTNWPWSPALTENKKFLLFRKFEGIEAYNLSDGSRFALHGGYYRSKVLPKRNGAVSVFWDNPLSLKFHAVDPFAIQTFPMPTYSNCRSNYILSSFDEEESVALRYFCEEGQIISSVLDLESKRILDGTIKGEILIEPVADSHWSFWEPYRYVINPDQTGFPSKMLRLASPENPPSLRKVKQNKVIRAPELASTPMTDASLSGLFALNSLSNTKVPRVLSQENELVAVGRRDDDSFRVFSIDTISSEIRSVCSNIPNQVVQIGRLTPGHDIFVMSYDEELRLIRFYRYQKSGTCPRMNEVPFQKAWSKVRRMIPGANGFIIEFETSERTTAEGVMLSTVFVPGDGRIPLILNPEGREFVQASSYHFSKDGSRIIFIGLTGQEGSKVFSFKVRDEVRD